MGFHHLRPDSARQSRRHAAAVSRQQNHQPESHRLAVSVEHAKVQLSPTPSRVIRRPSDVSPIISKCRAWTPSQAHRFDVRVDWAKSDRQRIFTRFSYDKLVFSTANVFPSPGWDPDYALNTHQRAQRPHSRRPDPQLLYRPAICAIPLPVTTRTREDRRRT